MLIVNMLLDLLQK